MRPGPAPGLFASAGGVRWPAAWAYRLRGDLALVVVQCSIGHPVRCCSPPWAFPPRLGPLLGAAPFLEVRSMFQLERLLMLPASLTPVAQLSSDTLHLGREALSLIGLRS